MSFMPTAASLVSAGTETMRELPIPAWSYGALALAGFLALLGVLWSFRNNAAKHDTPIRVTHGGPGDAHGASGAHDPGAHH